MGCVEGADDPACILDYALDEEVHAGALAAHPVLPLQHLPLRVLRKNLRGRRWWARLLVERKRKEKCQVEWSKEVKANNTPCQAHMPHRIELVKE